MSDLDAIGLYGNLIERLLLESYTSGIIGHRLWQKKTWTRPNSLQQQTTGESPRARYGPTTLA
jgi:hypothetical protein